MKELLMFEWWCCRGHITSKKTKLSFDLAVKILKKGIEVMRNDMSKEEFYEAIENLEEEVEYVHLFLITYEFGESFDSQEKKIVDVIKERLDLIERGEGISMEQEEGYVIVGHNKEQVALARLKMDMLEGGEW